MVKFLKNESINLVTFDHYEIKKLLQTFKQFTFFQHIEAKILYFK